MELDYLRDNGFGSDGYNLIKRNCNTFCNALSWRLLRKPIPPHINRLADIGNCCSCLLPKQLLEDSPVGGSGGGRSGGSSGGGATRSFAVPTTASMNRESTTPAFTGKGMSLGGGSSSTASTTTNSSETSGGGGGGFLSSWSNNKPTSTGQTQKDDLTDRREKARKAALARLERNQQQSTNTSEEKDQ